MKKKIAMAILACMISIILVLTIAELNMKRKAQNEVVVVDELKIIAIASYSNYAWHAQYRGIAIANDGSMYSWDETSVKKLNEYQLGTVQGVQDFILNEANKFSTLKVSYNDLVKINELINQVENNIEVNHVGADMGTSTTSVINDNNEEIKLKVSGDSIGENETEKAKELLELLDKYF